MQNNSRFPKIQPLKQYMKDIKPIGEIPKTNSKELKMLVGRKDIILDDTTALLNLMAVAPVKTKELDKNRLIKLIRLACDIRPQISFYGWNSFMLRLGISYGTKQCLELTQQLKEFIIKHGKSYREYMKSDIPFTWVKPNKEILKQGYDNLLYYNPESDTSKLKTMWVEIDGVYYLYDDFYQALIDYGYSKEQLRGVIHRCNVSKEYSLIPFYLRKKYLSIPNGESAMNKVLYGEN